MNEHRYSSPLVDSDYDLPYRDSVLAALNAKTHVIARHDERPFERQRLRVMFSTAGPLSQRLTLVDDSALIREKSESAWIE